MNWLKFPENKPAPGETVLALLTPQNDDLILRLGFDGENFVAVDYDGHLYNSVSSWFYNDIQYYIPMSELPPLPKT